MTGRRTRCTRIIWRAWTSPWSPPPPPVPGLPGGRAKEAPTPSASAARCQRRVFRPSVLFMGRIPPVRDVRVPPRDGTLWCLQAARARRAAAQVLTPTPRPLCACLLTPILNIYIHIQTVSPGGGGENCIVLPRRVLARSPAGSKQRGKKSLSKYQVINQRRLNGGIYFQPGGVNRGSSVGG